MALSFGHYGSVLLPERADGRRDACPASINELKTGESCAVPPKTAHYVHGKDDGPCRFLVLQGVGVYDKCRSEAEVTSALLMR